jgi:hypothetical protein
MEITLEGAKKYQTSPGEIEAIQYLGDNGSQIELWLGFHLISSMNAVFRPNGNIPQDFKIIVPSVGTANYGDYVTRDSTGTIYIVTAALFEQTYKQVEA